MNASHLTVHRAQQTGLANNALAAKNINTASVDSAVLALVKAKKSVGRVEKAA